MLQDFLKKFKQSLSKTREGMFGKIQEVIRLKPKIDESVLEEIEHILIQADIGIEPTLEIINRIREKLNLREISEDLEKEIQRLLEKEILQILQKNPLQSVSFFRPIQRPYVILIVGVNGAGKTTTIGKMAHRYKTEGKRVLLAACDTFRAAAIDQLSIWAKRTDADIVHHQPGSDPASVAFDALSAAKARNIDVVLIDTAGRLHTRTDLMEEVKKIRRVLNKVQKGAPHETLLVLDATTGQNAITQARQFHDDLTLTGLILAKLDSTAKGGVVIAIADKLGLSVRLVGVGEDIDDLHDFDPATFVKALF